jgi:hypothetical protein
LTDFHHKQQRSHRKRLDHHFGFMPTLNFMAFTDIEFKLIGDVADRIVTSPKYKKIEWILSVMRMCKLEEKMGRTTFVLKNVDFNLPKKRVKPKASSNEIEVKELFARIYQNDSFTSDAAHDAFSSVLKK